MMEPVILALESEYAGQVEFIIADFNDPETMRLLAMQEFQAPYIPAFYFIDSEGNIVIAEVGIFSYEEMKGFMESIL